MADDEVCIATPQPEMGVIEGESVNGHGGEEAPGGECAFREEAGPDFNVEADAEGSRETQRDLLRVKQGLFQNEGNNEDDDSGTDYGSGDKPFLKKAEHVGNAVLPGIFQTNQLLFYERFKAYQDYMLGDCKTSEVKAFIADYLEKVVEPCDWQALWCTEVFDVQVEVVDVDYVGLKASVELVLPMRCEVRGCEISEEAMRDLLEATQHMVPLQELHTVYDESGDFDHTALAVEHLRFFYKHIWRKWDEEDEDDDFDYFVRCVEPRLRLYYDILEDRVPAGLVAEYHSLLARCSEKFQEFSSLRNDICSDSESELDNVSMVEGLRMCEQMEALKRKLRIIENPLLRHVLGYKVNSGKQSYSAKGQREGAVRVVHVVSSSMTVGQLQTLMVDKLLPDFSGEQFELQFHGDPLLAIDACYEGDVVIICTGHYLVSGSINILDSIQVEGFGLSDEVVIEKRGKGDAFIEATAANAKISNLKFIQHDAIEGILCVRQGRLEMENCVLQCETTGVIVRTSAQLTMNMCDLYGAKGAGVEIYPGSICTLVGNGIHHCREGVLIKDFADDLDTLPRITMVNNVIHNNEGYGVILVKPADLPLDGGAVGGLSADELVSPKKAAHDSESGPMKPGGVQFEVPLMVVEEPPVDSHYDVPPDITEGNDAIKKELVATSAKKTQRQKRAMKELGVTQADDNLLSQEMFVSIQGNQFRRNGKGSFGTFQY